MGFNGTFRNNHFFWITYTHTQNLLLLFSSIVLNYNNSLECALTITITTTHFTQGLTLTFTFAKTPFTFGIIIQCVSGYVTWIIKSDHRPASTPDINKHSHYLRCKQISIDASSLVKKYATSQVKTSHSAYS